MTTGASTPRLLVATGNPGKIREIVALLEGLPVQVLAPSDLGRGPAPAVEETGETFLANARIKARAYAAWSGLAALADDSGLEVDALGGAPGVRSARYAGAGATDQANLDKLLAALDGVPPPRTGRFRCAAVLSAPGVGEWHGEAAWDGQIITTPRGSGGFGYDPVFVPDGWAQTSAEVPPAVKNAVSHRAQALAALRPAIEEWATAAPRVAR